MKNIPAPLFCFLVFTAFAASAASVAEKRPAVTLRSQRTVGQTDKVVVLMDVSGDFKERATGAQGKGLPVAMSGTCRLTYHEKTLAAGPGPHRAARYYENAESNVKFKDGGHSPSLGAERRLVGVAVDAPAVTLFSLGEPLSRDELEVIDILGNTVLLDDLLPQRPVAVGDVWRPDNKVVAALLGLGGTTRCDVQCVLREVTDTVAHVELTGSAEGPVNDTSARIKLKGRYRFDLGTKRIDWFALVTREDRGISQVAAGFDVGVRLQIAVTPEAAPPQLTDAKLAAVDLEPTPQRSRLAFQSPQDRWEILCDRCWYLNSDNRENALLKRIDQGSLVGQCNVSSLPEREPDKLVSLEEFQKTCAGPWERVSANSSRPSSRSTGRITACCGSSCKASCITRRRTRRSAGSITMWPTGGAPGGAHLHDRTGTGRAIRRRRPGDHRVVAVCQVAGTLRVPCALQASVAEVSSAVRRKASGRHTECACYVQEKRTAAFFRERNAAALISDFSPIATGCVASRRAKVRRASALAVK